MKRITFIFIVFFTSCKVSHKNKLSTNNDNVVKQELKSFNQFIESVKSESLKEICNRDLVINQKMISQINNFTNFNFDSLKPLDFKNQKLLYTTSINIINTETKNYQPAYYYFLLQNKDDNVKNIYFSKNYLYKKLHSGFDNIDLLILFNKIIQKDNTGNSSFIGYNMELLTYNNIKKKLIDRKRLITSGIGLEDVSYHECFMLNSNHITSYSYNSLEDESTFIERKMNINKNGHIIVMKPIVSIYD